MKIRNNLYSFGISYLNLRVSTFLFLFHEYWQYYWDIAVEKTPVTKQNSVSQLRNTHNLKTEPRRVLKQLHSVKNNNLIPTSKNRSQHRVVTKFFYCILDSFWSIWCVTCCPTWALPTILGTSYKHQKAPPGKFTTEGQ